MGGGGGGGGGMGVAVLVKMQQLCSSRGTQTLHSDGMPGSAGTDLEAVPAGLSKGDQMILQIPELMRCLSQGDRLGSNRDHCENNE